MEDLTQPRVRYGRAAPEPMRALSSIEQYLEGCGLAPALLDLVQLRASLLNGCAYCLQRHSHEARARGERVERLFQLGAWPESPVFSEQERAALEWTDAVTNVQSGHVPEEVYQRARRQFTEKELVDLTWAIAAINAWNRLSIAFRYPPEIR